MPTPGQPANPYDIGAFGAESQYYAANPFGDTSRRPLSPQPPVAQPGMSAPGQPANPFAQPGMPAPGLMSDNVRRLGMSLMMDPIQQSGMPTPMSAPIRRNGPVERPGMPVTKPNLPAPGPTDKQLASGASDLENAIKQYEDARRGGRPSAPPRPTAGQPPVRPAATTTTTTTSAAPAGGTGEFKGPTPSVDGSGYRNANMGDAVDGGDEAPMLGAAISSDKQRAQSAQAIKNLASKGTLSPQDALFIRQQNRAMMNYDRRFIPGSQRSLADPVRPPSGLTGNIGGPGNDGGGAASSGGMGMGSPAPSTGQPLAQGGPIRRPGQAPPYGRPMGTQRSLAQRGGAGGGGRRPIFGGTQFGSMG